MNKLREKFESADLCPKISYFHHFGHKKFLPNFNFLHQVHFQKNLMNRFREKFKKV